MPKVHRNCGGFLALFRTIEWAGPQVGIHLLRDERPRAMQAAIIPKREER